MFEWENEASAGTLTNSFPVEEADQNTPSINLQYTLPETTESDSGKTEGFLIINSDDGEADFWYEVKFEEPDIMQAEADMLLLEDEEEMSPEAMYTLETTVNQILLTQEINGTRLQWAEEERQAGQHPLVAGGLRLARQLLERARPK